METRLVKFLFMRVLDDTVVFSFKGFLLWKGQHKQKMIEIAKKYSKRRLVTLFLTN